MFKDKKKDIIKLSITIGSNIALKGFDMRNTGLNTFFWKIVITKIIFFHIVRKSYTLILLLIYILCIPSSVHAQSRLLEIMADELQREMSELKQQDTPPYYMNYTISDVHKTSISASFGALTDSDESILRLLTVEIRVGDYQLDNTHELRDQFDYYGFSSANSIYLPRDENQKALCAAIWQETNRRYREAVERYIKVKTNMSIKIAEEDSSADFSFESEPVTLYEPPIDITSLVGDKTVWEKKVKKYSALFLENEHIYGGRASFSFTVERKHLVTSEGTRLAHNLTFARISISGFIKSDDGMELPLYKNYFAFIPEDLPDDKTICNDVDIIIKKLKMLRDAPVVEPYTGPAILSGRASGVFFHEILGHRLEGHRQKSEYEGQTFKKHIGKKILPEHLHIIFDPTLKNYNNHDLIGHYDYDDEGIRAHKVKVVDSGVLKNFLMSRSPIESFPHSNGHGRAQAGRRPVSRQSNMIIKTTQPVPDKMLRDKLIKLCKKQNKPFGLLFQDIQGGFTYTGRSIPNMFNLLPTEVYRIYTDGRPDELVRGVDLVGTPLVIFSMISDAGETYDIFNGICGAESGSIPVSTISPKLLVSQVEVQKKSKSQERSPILPRPD